jgi:hypothetical protein
MHSPLARAKSSSPISRAISSHRCHLSGGIETASCVTSTTIGTPIGTSPFAASARPGCDAGAQTEPYASTVCYAPPSLARFVASWSLFVISGSRCDMRAALG